MLHKKRVIDLNKGPTSSKFPNRKESSVQFWGATGRGAARKSQKELNDAAVANRAAETAAVAVLPSLPSDEEDGSGWVCELGEGGLEVKLSVL